MKKNRKGDKMEKDKKVTVPISMPESMKAELDNLANLRKSSRSYALVWIYQEWKQCQTPKKSSQLKVT